MILARCPACATTFRVRPEQLRARQGRVRWQAGAGIVADSVPEKEWEETMNKGRALFRAAALAERGLDTPRTVTAKAPDHV